MHPPVHPSCSLGNFWCFYTLSATGLGIPDALSMQRHRTSLCIAWPCSQSSPRFSGRRVGAPNLATAHRMTSAASSQMMYARETGQRELLSP